MIDAAVTAALKVVAPVELTVKAPRVVELPTALVKVTLPEPAVTVRALLPFTVPLKVIPGVTPVVVKIM